MPDGTVHGLTSNAAKCADYWSNFVSDKQKNKFANLVWRFDYLYSASGLMTYDKFRIVCMPAQVADAWVAERLIFLCMGGWRVYSTATCDHHLIIDLTRSVAQCTILLNVLLRLYPIAGSPSRSHRSLESANVISHVTQVEQLSGTTRHTHTHIHTCYTLMVPIQSSRGK